MPANYLHGVETIELRRGPRPVRLVKSAVIALIGTAPLAFSNSPVLALSDLDDAQFGPELPGYTIPQALNAIRDQGPATVLIVNVLDPANHKTAVPEETKTFDVNNGRLKTTQAGLLTLVVKSNDGATTYVLNTDYTVDMVNGIVTRKAGGGIANGATVKLTYEHTDPTKVTSAEIIGTVTGIGARTGMKAFQDSYNLYGFFPKILIAPAYCTQVGISTEMIATADHVDAMALIDAPIGTTFAQAISGRGPMGAINFNTSHERAVLCFPHCKVLDTVTGAERLEPLSQRLAGVLAYKDIENGYWWSPSNTEIKGIIGMEIPLTARVDDPQSQVNLLNEVGIVTIFNSFGTGFRIWGNRSAAFPSSTHMTNFINVRRTGDIINESIRYFSLQYIDAPITQALIDDLVESVNAFGRKLVGEGALLGFKAWFDPARNPKTELAAGHLLISYKYTVPPPLERLTFETEVTDEFFLTLKAA